MNYLQGRGSQDEYKGRKQSPGERSGGTRKSGGGEGKTRGTRRQNGTETRGRTNCSRHGVSFLSEALFVVLVVRALHPPHVVDVVHVVVGGKAGAGPELLGVWSATGGWKTETKRKVRHAERTRGRSWTLTGVLVGDGTLEGLGGRRSGGDLRLFLSLSLSLRASGFSGGRGWRGCL